MIQDLLLDARHAGRRLQRSPGFTAATILILGLGIGATAAMFTVVHSVILEPLPYPEQDRLVWLENGAAGLGIDGGLDLTPGMYLHYQRSARLLEAIAIWDQLQVSLTGDDNPERLAAARVTHGLDEVLQVPPVLGRWFERNDTDTGVTEAGRVVVLSDGLWRRRYAADPSVLGRSLQINGVTHEIVGVAPAGFAYPNPATELWMPYVVDPARQTVGSFSYSGVARLRPDTEPDDARREMDTLIAGLPEAFPADADTARSVVDDAKINALVTPLREHIVGGVGRTLWMLLGSVSLLLLIACANVANLFLVRAESRQRELAVRAALGAGRARLLGFNLSESLLLSVAGGVLGLGLAAAVTRLVVGFGPSNLPRLHEVTIDPTVMAFTAAVALIASLLLGGMPMLGRSSLSQGSSSALRDGGRSATVGRGRVSGRNVLMVAQVAMALVLLVGSGLVLRSYGQLRNIHPGFVAGNVLTFELGLPQSEYDRAPAATFHRELLDELAALPGVTSVAASTCLPLCGSYAGDPLSVDGDSIVEPGTIPPIVATRRVTAGWFETLRIRLHGGRTFERADTQQRSGAAVVNEALVQAYWGNIEAADALGKRIYPGGDAENLPWYTIVGVVDGVPVREIIDNPPPTLYLPLLHSDDSGQRPNTLSYALQVGAPSSPLDLVAAVRSRVAAANPNLPIASIRTLQQVVAESSVETAFVMVLLAIAASVALTLSAVGIYSVISYLASQRTAEIGVRMALGADARSIRRMMLLHGGAVGGAGLVLGLAGAVALTRLLSTLLYDVSATDPLTYGVVAMVLLAVTLAATYLPARRAAGVDPVVALRSE